MQANSTEKNLVRLIRAILLHGCWKEQVTHAQFLDQAIASIGSGNERLNALTRVYAIAKQHLLARTATNESETTVILRPKLAIRKITTRKEFTVFHKTVVKNWYNVATEKFFLAQTLKNIGLLSQEKALFINHSYQVTELFLNMKWKREKTLYIAHDDANNIHGVAATRCTQEGTAITLLGSNPANLEVFGNERNRVRGAGTALIERIVQERIFFMNAHVHTGNLIFVWALRTAIPFYEKVGFRPLTTTLPQNDDDDDESDGYESTGDEDYLEDSGYMESPYTPMVMRVNGLHLGITTTTNVQ